MSDDDQIKAGVRQIRTEVDELKVKGLTPFLTSSLQSHSLPLLHIIHSIDSKIPVFFLNTGYHFPETIEFKRQLKSEFGFNINELTSPVSRSSQRDSNGRLMYASDPDYCCYMNKVLPLEPILKEYDVWINGVRAQQSSYRSNLNKFGEGKYETMHYHPIIDWTSQMIHEYRKRYDLPSHPLDEEGYISIGCMPCTRKMELDGDPREMRWFGMNKTECGLHTETVDKE